MVREVEPESGAGPNPDAPGRDPRGDRLVRGAVAEVLSGQVLLAPLTRAGNLPFRRLCVEYGARFTCSEMAYARRLVRGPSGERALLRRHESEPVFGVQIAGRDEKDLIKAARLAEDKGADYVDLNCGCPIDSVVRRGLGASLLERPRRIERLIAALSAAVTVPIFVKIRIGFREGKENAVLVAKAAEAGGVDAIAVHGRTREQRYRRPADWDRIAEVADAVSVPVIGNGDILDGADARGRLEEGSAAAVMVARGALIHPWLWQDVQTDDVRSRPAEERLMMMRRWVELALEHWGSDEHGFKRLRPFLELHVDFWRRYIPPELADAGGATMQGRETFTPRDELEEILLAPGDDGIARACDHILERFDPPPIALEPSAGRVRSAAGGWG